MKPRVLKNICILTVLTFLTVGITAVCADSRYIIEICDEAKTDTHVTIDSVELTGDLVTVSGRVRDGSTAVTAKVRNSENTLCYVGQPELSEKIYEFTFKTDASALGEFKAEMRTQYSDKLTYTFSITDADQIYNVLRARMSETASLIEECENEGLSVEYEKLSYSCAVHALGVTENVSGRADGNENDETIVSYNLEYIKNLIDKTNKKLTDYLNATGGVLKAQNKPALRLSTSGKTFMSDSSPVFLNGYCESWEEKKDETAKMKSLGANTAALAIKFKDIVGQADAPFGWIEQGGSVGWSDADFLTTDTESYDGERCLKIVNRTPAEANVTKYVYQYADLEPNTTYTLSAYLKGYGQSVTLNVGAGANCGRISKSISFPEWTYQSVTFTTDSNGLKNALVFIGTPDIASGVYVDGFSLLKNGDDKNLIVNGSFEDYYKAEGENIYGVSEAQLESYRNKCNDITDAGLYLVVSPAFHDVDTFKFLIRQDGVKGNGEQYSQYMKLNPTHPAFFAAVDIYLESVIPMIAQYENLVGFQIANEPRFNSYAHQYYVPEWKEYLAEKYGSVAGLNEIYNTSYSSFDEVQMPTQSSRTTLYFDYVTFNESIMTQFHGHISGKIHELSLNVPVFTKAMTEKSSQVEPASMTYGMNYENSDLSGYFDYNGNDSWSYLDNSYNTVQAELLWYDTQTSVKNRPVLNLENHYVADDSTVSFDARIPDWYRTCIWQGAIHGLGANLTWLWDISDSVNTAFRNPTVQYRTDVMLENGKVAYDLNRLAPEISLLQNKPCDAAILHSHTTTVYNYQHDNSLYTAYKSFLYKGFKPFIANEYDISQIGNYDILIIPEVTHASDETVGAVRKFAAEGGRVYLFGEDCFKYDENGIERSTGITDIAEKVYPVTRNFASKKSSISGNIPVYIGEIMGQAPLTLTDSDNVEITYTERNGRLIVNLCNYGSSTKNVTLSYAGFALRGGTDLINNSSVTDTVTLMTNKPLLLEYCKTAKTDEKFDLIDNEGNVIKSDIKRLVPGKIRYNAQITTPEGNGANAIVFMVHSNESGLISVEVNKGNGSLTNEIAIDAVSPGDTLKVYVWSAEDYTPLTAVKEL